MNRTVGRTVILMWLVHCKFPLFLRGIFSRELTQRDLIRNERRLRIRMYKKVDPRVCAIKLFPSDIQWGLKNFGFNSHFRKFSTFLGKSIPQSPFPSCLIKPSSPMAASQTYSTPRQLISRLSVRESLWCSSVEAYWKIRLPEVLNCMPQVGSTFTLLHGQSISCHPLSSISYFPPLELHYTYIFAWASAWVTRKQIHWVKIHDYGRHLNAHCLMLLLHNCWNLSFFGI